MKDKNLLENLDRLGFPLMETKEYLDVNKTLAEVVKSNDMRLWEGFPIMLVHAAEDYSFAYKKVLALLPNKQQQVYYHNLLIMSLAIYQHHKLRFVWADRLKDRLESKDVDLLQKLKNLISQNKEIDLNQKQFLPDRLLEIFSNYFKKNTEKAKKQIETYEQLSLEFALSQLFSPKQKELFKKKLNGEPLNKTEREYYSRTVKKKVAAIANSDLHRLAKRLMAY